MTIAIKGTPVWQRATVITDIDGNPAKVNYNGVGIINPLTDVSAEGFNRLASDVVALSNLTPLCVISFSGREATSAVPMVNSCILANGSTAYNYTSAAVPAGFPTVVQTSSAVYTVTFPATMTDQFGVSANIVARFAQFTAQHPVAPSVANAALTSGTVITVNGFRTSATITVQPDCTYFGVIL